MVLFGYFLPRRLPINWHEGRPLQSRTGWARAADARAALV